MPACGSRSLTDVLPHRNIMPQTQDMKSHPVTVGYTDTGPTCRCAINWCGTPHYNTQLTILMIWVRRDRYILPRPSTHTPANAQMYDAVVVVVSQKLGRKCTVPTVSWTCGVPIHYAIRSPTAASFHTRTTYCLNCDIFFIQILMHMCVLSSLIPYYSKPIFWKSETLLWKSPFNIILAMALYGMLFRFVCI